MSFDFDAAISTPFRMQPGLRRLAPGSKQLSVAAPGQRHQREKFAVLSAFAEQALLARAGFDPAPALAALATQAAAEHPQAWEWDGSSARAAQLGVSVSMVDGDVLDFSPGIFGMGDEIGRCLRTLPRQWRLAGLLSLTFNEDFAIVDGVDGTVPWLAVTLPSHWAPEEKVGRHFTEIHAPVADNALLLHASAALLRMVTGPQRWERFVWNITGHARLHAHPLRVDRQRWPATVTDWGRQAWLRTERQTFIPLPDEQQAVFTIGVDLVALAEAAANPKHAALLRDAIATMSPAVLEYRGLSAVRDPLLHWLAARRDAA